MLQVSCCGLEELQQLFRKHAAACDKWLGPGWRQLPQLQVLLQLPPGKRYSRQHMPEVSGQHAWLCWMCGMLLVLCGAVLQCTT